MPRYNIEVEPPAAFIEVQVTDPVSGATQRLPAKLDTGAAISVLPIKVTNALGLHAKSEAIFYDYNGVSQVRPLYYVDLDVEGHRLSCLEVTSSRRQDMLLGRDVLNQFIITLNGKDLTFDIKDP